MKSIIIYASTHHGNTRKVVEAIEKECGVDTVDSTKVREKDLKEYDLIGFASGIFFTKFSEQVLNFARVNLPREKEVFFIATAGNPMQMYFNSIAEVAKDKKCKERGRFLCKGFDTYGPFKIMRGIQKGHPDEAELKEAVAFYKGIIVESS